MYFFLSLLIFESLCFLIYTKLSCLVWAAVDWVIDPGWSLGWAMSINMQVNTCCTEVVCAARGSAVVVHCIGRLQLQALLEPSHNVHHHRSLSWWLFQTLNFQLCNFLDKVSQPQWLRYRPPRASHKPSVDALSVTYGNCWWMACEKAATAIPDVQDPVLYHHVRAILIQLS